MTITSLVVCCTQTFTAISQTISTAAGIAYAGGVFGDGGPATNATFTNPMGICPDGSGGYYIATYLDNRVRHVTAAGIISTVAGTGVSGYSGDGGPATAAELYWPQSVCYNTNTGDLYIADIENHVVRRVNSSGTISTYAGINVPGYNGDGILATAAKLYYPFGLAVDINNNLYICDNHNGRLRMVDNSGYIWTVAGTGIGGDTGDGGLATAARVSGPSRVALDGTGNIYFDGGYNRVRRIDASGYIWAFAGNGGAWGYGGDGGPATLADLALNNPGGVNCDKFGNVYISDVGNHRVRMVDPGGTITTVAGNGIPGYLGDGGPATAAKIANPIEVAADDCGNIYIAQWGGTVVRKITYAPLPIVGASHTVCEGEMIGLNNPISGGTWSSSDPAVASVGTGMGIVTGVSAGSVVISYTSSCGTATYSLTVDPLPSVSGTLMVCVGSNTTLTGSPTTGSSWTSASANVNVTNTGTPGEGAITGISAGTAEVTYTTSAMTCPAKVIVSVDMPATLSGPAILCTGSSFVMGTGGALYGTWSSSNTSRATVGTNGLVTGVGAGVVTISYVNVCGTYTRNITINASPTISGPTPIVCVGSFITLTGSPAVAGWSGSSPIVNVANTTLGNGKVTGLAQGVSVITYTRGGCSATIAVTVGSMPTVNGMTSICQGDTWPFNNGGAMYGTWSSSNTGVGTVSSSGQVTGVGGGTCNISYTNVCGSSWITITVNATPGISGPTLICRTSGAVTLNGTPAAGGAWSGGGPNASIANVAPGAGKVTPLSAGTDIMTYTAATGCYATVTVSVDVNPAISGPTSVCISNSIGLSSGGGLFGTWSSSNTGLATVNSSGVVSGVAAGVVTISYTNVCGLSTWSVTVNSLPTVSGTPVVCTGAAVTLSGSPAIGGYWYGSSTVASIVSGTSPGDGILTGITAGTTEITYNDVNGCKIVLVATVDGTPPITGPHHVCVGDMISLSDLPGGGTWSSAVAGLVNATTGVVTGVTWGGGVHPHGGEAFVDYTDACGTVSYVVVVMDLPNISGTATVCEGSTTTLMPDGTYGTWSGSNAVASVGTMGDVTGLSGGTVELTFTSDAGCSSTIIVTVYPMPTACISSQTVGMYDEFDFSGTIGATVYYAMQDNTMAIVGYGSITIGGSGTYTIVETSLPASVVRLCIDSVELNGCFYPCNCTLMYGCCASIHPIGHKPGIVTQPQAGAMQILSVTPNPNSGTFTVAISGMKATTGNGGKVQIEVIDMLGNAVATEYADISDGITEKQIRLRSDIANGMYLVKVVNDSESQLMRFVLNR